MGEFTSTNRRGKSMAFALRDILLPRETSQKPVKSPIAVSYCNKRTNCLSYQLFPTSYTGYRTFRKAPTTGRFIFVKLKLA
jgi:hypothetical protein